MHYYIKIIRNIIAWFIASIFSYWHPLNVFLFLLARVTRMRIICSWSSLDILLKKSHVVSIMLIMISNNDINNLVNSMFRNKTKITISFYLTIVTFYFCMGEHKQLPQWDTNIHVRNQRRTIGDKSMLYLHCSLQAAIIPYSKASGYWQGKLGKMRKK